MCDTVNQLSAHQSDPATQHENLVAWVQTVAELTRPASIQWCDGSEEEWGRLTRLLVRTGTLTQLNPAKRPNSFRAITDPSDVARVESRTFVCTEQRDEAGPNNNWVKTAEMRATLQSLFDGCMRGRTMYVVPFVMGPLESPSALVGVEITDSPYVVVSMKIMTRMGSQALTLLGDSGTFAPSVHSVGRPLRPGDRDVAWPCNHTKYIVHYPETREIWSFGSGYGGNALLSKKCFALRIASTIGREEGWLAEHMLTVKVTSPKGEVRYIAAAFPSACGKTNMAMLESTLAGWTVETLGDDICWLRMQEDGRLYAINPEAGFFGVAPGTGPMTNRNAVETLQANCILTNVALTDDGDVWWEGLTDSPPHHLIDWTGKDWSPASPNPAAHPNARFTAPAKQCPSIAKEWDAPFGVPISAILMGGRRASVVPLVVESFNWQHGVFMASNLSSEATAAAENTVGEVRRDPFAMAPFCGYNFADYFHHWLGVGARARQENLPRIYIVNWFRKDKNGKFIWPGFGENIRVLKWIFERLDGSGTAVETVAGWAPTRDSLDLAGLSLEATRLEPILSVDAGDWREEVERLKDYYLEFGDRIPGALMDEASSALQATRHDREHG